MLSSSTGEIQGWLIFKLINCPPPGSSGLRKKTKPGFILVREKKQQNPKH